MTLLCFFFFFNQKTAYEIRISDWSSDVCSSDLPPANWSPNLAKARRKRKARRRNAAPIACPCALQATDSTPSASSRSEERRVGKEGVSKGRSRWSPDTDKNNYQYTHMKQIIQHTVSPIMVIYTN